MEQRAMRFNILKAVYVGIGLLALSVTPATAQTTPQPQSALFRTEEIDQLLVRNPAEAFAIRVRAMG